MKADESYWMFSDGELNIGLQKMTMGETWDCALKGRTGAQVDDFTKEEIRKKMMLERFAYEVKKFYYLFILFFILFLFFVLILSILDLIFLMPILMELSLMLHNLWVELDTNKI